MEITLSALGHTWILDLDGTLVVHNGYKIYGKDKFLEGAKEFLEAIPGEDMVIIITSRKLEYKEMTESFLEENGIRYDQIIYEAPYGERILVNDNKPSGLKTGYVVNKERDEKLEIGFVCDG